MFQSTPSTQRETSPNPGKNTVYRMFQSTPSTQRETSRRECTFPYRKCFNPLPLRRGRHGRDIILVFDCSFNPLPLRRGRHMAYKRVPAAGYVSIHSLYAEGDCKTADPVQKDKTFQSTPSTQRETRASGICDLSLWFQSTPSTQRETLICFAFHGL